jgi:hypothetical protein
MSTLYETVLEYIGKQTGNYYQFGIHGSIYYIHKELIINGNVLNLKRDNERRSFRVSRFKITKTRQGWLTIYNMEGDIKLSLFLTKVMGKVPRGFINGINIEEITS